MGMTTDSNLLKKKKIPNPTWDRIDNSQKNVQNQSGADYSYTLLKSENMNKITNLFGK